VTKKVVAKVKLWWHLLTVQTIPSNDTPTVMAPAQEVRREIPAPPRIPFEFGLFIRHDCAPDSDPLRDSFPLRKHL
jgi:hypothetical protein